MVESTNQPEEVKTTIPSGNPSGRSRGGRSNQNAAAEEPIQSFDDLLQQSATVSETNSHFNLFLRLVDCGDKS